MNETSFSAKLDIGGWTEWLVREVVRRAFGTGLTAVLALTITIDTSGACSLPYDWTPRSSFDQAKIVFLATIDRAEYKPIIVPTPQGNQNQNTTNSEEDWYTRNTGIVSIHYSLVEEMKGNPPSKGEVVTSSFLFGACGGFPVLVGNTYLLYVDEIPSTQDFSEIISKMAFNPEGVISTLASVDVEGDPGKNDAVIDARKFAKSTR